MLRIVASTENIVPTIEISSGLELFVKREDRGPVLESETKTLVPEQGGFGLDINYIPIEGLTR